MKFKDNLPKRWAVKQDKNHTRWSEFFQSYCNDFNYIGVDHWKYYGQNAFINNESPDVHLFEGNAYSDTVFYTLDEFISKHVDNMKNLQGLPEIWAIDMKAEAKHTRMKEFRIWHEKNLYPEPKDWNYYGYNCWNDVKNTHWANHRNDVLLEGVTLITLDQFFEALGGKPKPITPIEGQLIDVMYNGVWISRQCLYYNQEFKEVVARIDSDYGTHLFSSKSWRFPEKVKVKQSDLIAHYCKSLDLDPNNLEIV